MQSNTLSLVFFGALVAAGIGAALLTIGGPGQGKLKERNKQRHEDLNSLNKEIRCSENWNQGQIPDSLGDIKPCNPVLFAKLKDPKTNAPYRYRRLHEKAFELCADFENGEYETAPRYSWVSNFNKQTGCYRFKR